MKTKLNFSPWKYVSFAFLDLICCSFGAALLMFLIVASVEEEVVENTNKLFVVRIRHIRGFYAEMGIEFKKPGSSLYVRADPKDNSFFSALSKPDSGSEAFLILYDPIPGNWSFRAFLVNYPYWGEEDSLSTTFQLEIWGLDAHSMKSSENTLSIPGQTSQEILVEIFR